MSETWLMMLIRLQLGARGPHDAARDHAGLGEQRLPGQGDVLRRGAVEVESLALAVLRHHHDARLDRGARVARVDLLAVDDHLAGVGAVGARDGPHRLGASGSDEPGDPEYLARVHLEVDVGEHAVPAEVAHLKDRAVVRRWRRLVRVGELAPDHRVDEVGPRHAAGVPGGHPLAVAQADDAVGDTSSRRWEM